MRSHIVTKAIIPVAGLGTRFLPITKAVPKEMLPIIDRPTLEYVIDEALAAGIAQIILVNGRHKQEIENYFDRNCELERALSERGKQAELELLRSIDEKAEIVSVRQREAKGLGHAVLCAAHLCGDEPVAILLGDDIMRATSEKPYGIAELIKAYSATGLSQVGLMQVKPEDAHLYGVAAGELFGRSMQINKLVEKPPFGQEPSDMAVVGRYVVTPTIWPILRDLAPGRGGEIQLTDALDILSRTEGLGGVVLRDQRVDVGCRIGFLEANLREAMHRPEMRVQTIALMQELLASVANTRRSAPRPSASRWAKSLPAQPPFHS